jgi:hypothetical protein
VDSPGQQFFAGAALAFQKHDAIVCGDGVYDGQNVPK